MSRALLLKTFDYLGRRIQSAHLNESAADGTQALQKEIAEYLDAPQSTPARSQAQERGELREAWQKLELVAANCQPFMQAYHKIKKEWNAVDNAVRALSTPATDAGGEAKQDEIDRLLWAVDYALLSISNTRGESLETVPLLAKRTREEVLTVLRSKLAARPSGEPGDTLYALGRANEEYSNLNAAYQQLADLYSEAMTDANRYRFLRTHWSDWTGNDWRGTPNEVASKLDAAMDKAMTVQEEPARPSGEPGDTGGEPTDEQFEAAIKKAVEVGLVPRYDFIDVAADNRDKIKQVVRAAHPTAKQEGR